MIVSPIIHPKPTDVLSTTDFFSLFGVAQNCSAIKTSMCLLFLNNKLLKLEFLGKRKTERIKLYSLVNFKWAYNKR